MGRSEFDRAIALSTTADASVVRGVIDDAWRVGNGVNGGILVAMAAAALRRVLDQDGRHPDPLALSAYFCTPLTDGAVSVRAQVLRSGRTMSTGQFAMCQADQTGRSVDRVRGLAIFGALAQRTGPVLRTAAAPRMPPVGECRDKPQRSGYPIESRLLDRVDLRLDPACAGWLRGEPSHRGVIQGWLRLADGREPDVLSLLWALDALPPVIFDLGVIGWTPTLEFTGHVRAHPAPGWLQVVTTTADVSGGLMQEDARIWDSTGRLVASSRQLCAWRLPPTEAH